MAVRLVVTLTAAKGKGDEFARAFCANLPNVQKEPGCEQYAFFRSLEDPDRFVLLERWKDQAALDVHAALLRSRPSSTASLRGGPPTMERYEVP
jgi:quinol monooxygenase YgiN